MDLTPLLKVSHRILNVLQYDTSIPSAQDIFNSTALCIVAAHNAYQLDICPEQFKDMIDEEIYAIRSVLERDTKDVTDYNVCVEYLMRKAERAKIARERIHYGTQIATRIGVVVKQVAGVRVIGAESRLEYRDSKRSIRDIDLFIDLYNPGVLKPTQLRYIRRVAQDAESKTGIPVDIICPGLETTEWNLEHTLSILDYPIGCRGFPVFFREVRYLQHILDKKNEFFKDSIRIALEAAEKRQNT